METAEKKAGAQGVNAKANGTVTKVENRSNLTGKEAKENGNSKVKPATENPKVAGQENTSTKTGDSLTVDNQPVNAEQQSPKAEIKYIKPTPNLEQTLKSVGELHRLTIQRSALMARIKQLEAFEIDLQENSDELSSNQYEGCKLIIEDDKHRQFVTKTPNLIRMVSQFIFNACDDKLAEIEAQIVFPNA